MANKAWFAVTLKEWLESQRLESTPHRAALQAALDAGDTAAVRRFLDGAPFSHAQRRYLEDLISRWESDEDV